MELTKRREELERELQDLEEVFYRTAKEGEKYANESKDYKKRLRKLNSEEAVYRDGAERARGNVEKWRLDIENEEAGLQAKEKAIHETAQRKLASLQADLRASEEQLHDLEVVDNQLIVTLLQDLHAGSSSSTPSPILLVLHQLLPPALPTTASPPRPPHPTSAPRIIRRSSLPSSHIKSLLASPGGGGRDRE